MKAEKKSNEEIRRLTENNLRAEAELRNRAYHIPANLIPALIVSFYEDNVLWSNFEEFV